jgi:hypothetical protein
MNEPDMIKYGMELQAACFCLMKYKNWRLILESIHYTYLERLLSSHYPSGVAFVIRHAERYPIENPAGVFEADLTEKGYRDAFEFGKKLSSKYRLQSISSSPLQRCIHTGEAISQGFGMDIPIRGRWWLFSPFLNNNHPDAEAIKIAPTGNVKDRLIAGVDKNTLDMLLNRIFIPRDPDSLTLYISHDSTVSPLAAYLEGKDTIYVEQYPGYLEGIALVRDNSRLVIL